MFPVKIGALPRAVDIELTYGGFKAVNGLCRLLAQAEIGKPLAPCCTRVSHYFAYLSRNTFFCTFPIALRGSSATTAQRLGTLKWANWAFSWVMMDLGDYAGPGALQPKLLGSNSLGFIPKRAAAQRPLAHLLVACWVE